MRLIALMVLALCGCAAQEQQLPSQQFEQSYGRDCAAELLLLNPSPSPVEIAMMKLKCIVQAHPIIMGEWQRCEQKLHAAQGGD